MSDERNNCRSVFPKDQEDVFIPQMSCFETEEERNFKHLRILPLFIKK